jgi:Zn-dependent M28 family amino/carboxypeptidase
MKNLYFFLALLLISNIGSLAQGQFQPVEKSLETVQPDSIRAHITLLADDRLLGRKPGKPGYTMAVDYVVSRYKAMGLLPAGDKGSYLQKVVLRNAKLKLQESSAQLSTDSGVYTMQGKDYFFFPSFEDKVSEFNAPLVFVGYGISAPEFGYDDYANIDVKGKIVVLVSGSPDKLVSTVKSHVASNQTKMKTALEKGAIGMIIKSGATAVLENFRYAVSNSGIETALNPHGKMFLPTYFGGSGMGIKISGMIHHNFFAKMVQKSDEELPALFNALKNGEPKSFDLKNTLQGKVTSSFTDIESYNVCGLIPGSDKKLKDEYVVHTAHLDHVGVGTPVEGDSIYNGAHDNASGVACALEIARLYSTLKSKPKRSILFVMVTAEEMGLLGSSYFAAFPSVPKDKIVADVNTDMPTIVAPLLSVVPLGAMHSSLINHVKNAAEYLKIDIEEDPEPEQNRFVRSDQYSFVTQGIPALHIKYGDKTKEPGVKLSQKVKDWRTAYYHRPKDQIDGNMFDFNAGKTYVQLNFLISYGIAQATERPTWNEGDFFKKKFYNSRNSK